MKKIDSTTLYTGQELKDILHGFVKMDVLRQFGLVGSPGAGYWGRNVIDSLNRYWDNLACQRGMGKATGKEKDLDSEHAIFDNRANEVPNGSVHSSPGKARAMESERQRYRRQVSTDPLPSDGPE